MSKSVNLGGERLGSGNKMKVGLHGYRSSNVNLGYVFRNTQAPGTLVPFLVEYAQPADNFRINLDSRVLTHPTVGPLFGSFKVQYDIFVCPIRLYHSRLHNNPTEIGMQTETIKFPQLDFQGCNVINDKSEIPVEMQQINPSSIFSYLGLNGFGSSDTYFNRQFNALPYLSYWIS